MRRLLPALLALACGPAAIDGTDPVVASHEHYVVSFSSELPASAGAEGSVRLRIDGRGGWHVAEDGPASLELEAPEGIALEPASLGRDDVRVDEGGFEFIASLRAERAGRQVAKGRLKFGICEGPDEKCVIVRRDLDLPIDVAFE